jgi:hypothetical protein
VADKRRFEHFASFIVEHLPGERVFDVAGGMGKLNEALSTKGRSVTTFDMRHKHLPVRFEERQFSLEEPCACEVVVGMHPDGATRLIIEYAARHRIAFAVVPCCSDNGMPYRPWMRHLEALARELGFTDVGEASLPMDGRARVLFGRPSNR